MLTSKEAHTSGKTGPCLLTCGKAWKLSQHTFSCAPSMKVKGTVNSGPSLWLMAPLIRESWGLTFEIHTYGCSQTTMSISFSEKKPLEIVPFNNNRSYWNLVSSSFAPSYPCCFPCLQTGVTEQCWSFCWRPALENKVTSIKKSLCHPGECDVPAVLQLTP